ncbi:MAG: sodium:proton antiporter [Bacteroidota bacterium]
MTFEIISLCSLLLLAYVFDISASITKIPSIVLLLLTGWLVKQVAEYFGLQIIDLRPLLPALGTIGLILIVLEGSLELELNHYKKAIIRKSAIVSLFPMLLLSFLMAWAFAVYSGVDYKIALVNAIPLAVISSAIAIPSAKGLSKHNREFVIYESSLSDIFGVLFFNFIALNAEITVYSFGNFGLQLVLMLLVTFVATLLLAFLLGRIKHHVKFVPIIILIILIYAISKVYHLPALMFILILGLFLNNFQEMKKLKWINKLHPEILKREVNKFRELTAEAAFLIRALFFLLFGYSIATEDLLNSETIFWAEAIVIAIFTIRALFLKISKLPLFPLLFIAPRGLITILLFFSILPEQTLGLVNQSLVIQVILLSALVLMTGMMWQKKESPAVNIPELNAKPEDSKI